MQDLEKNASSARQISELAELYRQKESTEREEKAIQRRGIQEQISTGTTLSALLKHNLEQAMQQDEREKIETARYNENLKFTKIAAWTSIAGVILAIAGIILQLTL